MEDIQHAFKQNTYDLADAVLAFKGTEFYGFKADNVIERLASHEHQPRHHYDPKPLSKDNFMKRIEFVDQSIRHDFKHHNIDHINYSPINHGNESLVIDCNNGYVVKIKTGIKPYSVPPSRFIAQPLASGELKDLGTSYGIFKRAEPVQLGIKETYAFIFKAYKDDGIIISDPHKHNFGYELDNETGKKKLVFLDADATNNRPSFMNAALAIVAPVFSRMPILHKPLRRLRYHLKMSF